MKHKITLEEKLDRINDFFDKLSEKDFEKMAFEAGFGEIKESSVCSYVLATKEIFDDKYVNEQKMLIENGNNQFSFEDGRILEGAA